MADWATISQVATAAGTTVLAVATFSSIKASQRATRLAERAMLAGQRPLLIPSREDDPPERVRFVDGVTLTVCGHGSRLERHGDNVYLGISLRNGGAGIAVIQGWTASAGLISAQAPRPEPEEFRPQTRDLYIPAGDTGFWQGAARGVDDPLRNLLIKALDKGEEIVMVDLLYGDHEGGQRTITRFRVSAPEDERPRAEVIRVWVLDGVDPRRA